VTTWLNTSFQTRFRVIDGLTVRFALGEDRGDHALLLSPWPESLFAFEPVWSWLAEHDSYQACRTHRWPDPGWVEVTANICETRRLI
jgi:hypothetical protein